MEMPKYSFIGMSRRPPSRMTSRLFLSKFHKENFQKLVINLPCFWKVEISFETPLGFWRYGGRREIFPFGEGVLSLGGSDRPFSTCFLTSAPMEIGGKVKWGLRWGGDFGIYY